MLDLAIVELVKALGGILAIAISHPHDYTSMVAWSRACGDVPTFLHAADRQWVVRPGKAIALCEPKHSGRRTFQAPFTREFHVLLEKLDLSFAVEPEEGIGDPPPPDSYQANLLDESHAGLVSNLHRKVTLTNGSLAENSSVAHSHAATSWNELRELHQYFPHAVRDCQLWTPSETLLKQIRLLNRIGKTECVVGNLLMSLQRDSVPIDPSYADDPPPAEQLSHALRCWRNSVEVASTTEGPRKAFAHRMAVHERLHLKPLIDAAAQSDDPVKSNLLITLVEVKRMLLPVMLQISQSNRCFNRCGISVREPLVPSSRISLSRFRHYWIEKRRSFGRSRDVAAGINSQRATPQSLWRRRVCLAGPIPAGVLWINRLSASHWRLI